jgi:excisionase family DNA binding protein
MSLFTIHDVAPLLKISEITVRRFIKDHSIPYHKIGKKYFFTDEDLQAYFTKVAVPMREEFYDNTK